MARRQRAFTLVETLVSLSLVLILIGLLLPALRGARVSADELAAQAHQAQVGSAVVLAYAGDHNNAFPYYGVPGTNQTLPWRIPFGALQGQDNPGMRVTAYWEQYLWWNLWIETQGYDGRMTAEANGRDLDTGIIGVAVDMLTSCATAADRYFTEDGVGDVSLHQGRRFDEVRSTSLKGVLWRMSPLEMSDRWESDARVIVWFADAHSELAQWGDFRHSGLALPPRSGSHLPINTTRHGLAGRDK